MSIRLSEQDTKDRITRLMTLLQAAVKTIQEIDKLIGGIGMVYTRAQYGSKVKKIRKQVMEAYVDERKAMVQRQENLVQQIEDYQKGMEKPLIQFQRMK